ncbi:uncharacterized protein [Ptychodera flava]|uniref:uncharacterized protein n=1 Tax=Ptychodera flava TaxID=63121 RepID=UPI00396A1238
MSWSSPDDKAGAPESVNGQVSQPTETPVTETDSDGCAEESESVSVADLESYIDDKFNELASEVQEGPPGDSSTDQQGKGKGKRKKGKKKKKAEKKTKKSVEISKSTAGNSDGMNANNACSSQMAPNSGVRRTRSLENVSQATIDTFLKLKKAEETPHRSLSKRQSSTPPEQLNKESSKRDKQDPPP